MRRASTLLRTAALGALALVTLGCTDDDDDDDAADTTAAAAETSPGESLIEPAATTADDGSGDTLAGVPDPCTLIPADAISAVLGEAVAGVTAIPPTPPLNLRQCEWSLEADGALRAIYLSIETTQGYAEGGAGGPAQMAASDQYEGTRSAYAAAVDLTGLGDAAYFTNADETEIHVLSGDAFVRVIAQTIGSSATPITGDQLRSLAEAAVASL
jgi:hypothetical protein